MHKLTKLAKPQYFDEFKCIASECPDSCCTGWDIAIDEDAYNKYKSCKDNELQPILQNKIIINNKSIQNSTYTPYALIELDNHTCPFLTNQKLCLIQKNLNEDALSITCSNYPRNMNIVDETVERYLCVSCPEAARLILLKEEPITMIESEYGMENIKNNRISYFYSANSYESKKPYRFFKSIRNFCIGLLQNRKYTVPQRLMILNKFCFNIDKVSPEYYETDIPYLIKNFDTKIINREFDVYINDFKPDLNIQLQAIKMLIDYSLHEKFVSERYQKCILEFSFGIGLSTDHISNEVLATYCDNYKNQYEIFMDKHDYIIENHIVNQALKNLFPFGAQNKTDEMNSLYDEFILLALQFAMIKTLLIGASGYYREKFYVEHVINTIQVFTKNIGHNDPFLNRALEFIKAAQMNNINGMNELIKN